MPEETAVVAKGADASKTAAQGSERGEARMGAADREEAGGAGPRKTRRRSADLGQKGEQAAARFLERRGFEILERNWKCKAGEADIIAEEDDSLVFIEVKTRSNCDKGLPEEAVTPKKRSRYERIAAYFLAEHDITDKAVRFDVISILVVAPERAFLRHHRDAFGF